MGNRQDLSKEDTEGRMIGVPEHSDAGDKFLTKTRHADNAQNARHDVLLRRISPFVTKTAWLQTEGLLPEPDEHEETEG